MDVNAATLTCIAERYTTGGISVSPLRNSATHAVVAVNIMLSKKCLKVSLAHYDPSRLDHSAILQEPCVDNTEFKHAKGNAHTTLFGFQVFSTYTTSCLHRLYLSI